jgi:hypothetical protein
MTSCFFLRLNCFLKSCFPKKILGCQKVIPVGIPTLCQLTDRYREVLFFPVNSPEMMTSFL